MKINLRWLAQGTVVLIIPLLLCNLSKPVTSPFQVNHSFHYNSEFNTYIHPDSAQSAGSSVVEFAEEIVNNLEFTTYSHQPLLGTELPNVQRLANGKFVVETDCSGLVSYVLNQVNPVHYQAIEQFKRQVFPTEQKWPRAYVYQKFFESLSSQTTRSTWQPVSDLRQVQPGDIIAWCLDQHCVGNQNGQEKADDTGHIMIVAQPSRKVGGEALQSLVLFLEQNNFGFPPGLSAVYAVDVYDSSSSHHYGDDPRKQGGVNGAGSGSLYFAINSEGVPIAFQFPEGSFKYTQMASACHRSELTGAVQCGAKQVQRTVQISIGRLL